MRTSAAIIGWRYASPDQPKAEPTERVPTTHEVQSAFEDWLERKRPSGDHAAVMWQWHASSDYLDLFRVEPTELERLREAIKLLPEALYQCENISVIGDGCCSKERDTFLIRQAIEKHFQPFIKP